MQILTSVRRILAFVGLSGGTSSQENVRARIQRVVLRSAVVAFLILWIMGCILLIINDIEKGIVAILRPLSLGFAGSSALAVYLCLIGRARQIDELNDYLEDVVNNCM